MSAKKKPPKYYVRALLDGESQAHLKRCTQKLLDEPDQMHPPKPCAVIRWALRKCAAEVREG